MPTIDRTDDTWWKPANLDDWSVNQETTWFVLLFAQGCLRDCIEDFADDPHGTSMEEEDEDDRTYVDDDTGLTRVLPPQDPDVKVAEHAGYLRGIAEGLHGDFDQLLWQCAPPGRLEPLLLMIKRGNQKINDSWQRGVVAELDD